MYVYSGGQKLQDDFNMAAVSYFQHTCNFLDILVNSEQNVYCANLRPGSV